jgi:tRNA pseudouridine55 synthase
LLHGWIVLDKLLGLGSTQAVSAVKRALREAGEPKTKVGHGGTLDPLASGVLPIAIGEATKLAGRMLDATKAYDFTISFGDETDTLDAEGETIATSEVRPTAEEVEAILPRFTGAINQVPPAYSALKIGGKPAYSLSRSGEAVEMKPRSVTVHSLKILPAGAAGGEGDRSAQPSGGGAPPSALRAATSPSLRDREGLHRVNFSPFSAFSRSSFEKLKSGFIRSSCCFSPATILVRPSILSAQYIGPPL